MGTLLSILGSAAFAALIGGVANVVSTHLTNKQNQEINQSQLDYNAAQTQQAWERDDTAHQREVADLKAAGLSPLASTGGLNVTSPLGAPSPIAMQAPQVDVNSLVQGLLGSEELRETKRHNEQIETMRSSELQIEAEKVLNQANALDIENKKVESEIKYYARLNELEAKKIDETIRNHKKEEELKLSENERKMIEYQSQMFLKDIERQTGGTDIPYYEIYDFEIYVHSKKLYNLKLQHFIEKIGATQSASANSYGYNQSDSFGINGGAKVAGSGAQGGFDWSETTGENTSQYNMQNMSEKQAKEWYAFLQENKCPVYIDKSKYDKLY